MQLLVSTEGKIINYNRRAVELIKNQNKSVEILKGGDFGDIFDDFKEQAKSIIQKTFKGEPSEEVYTKKLGADFGDAKADIGCMVMADSIS